MKSTEMIEEIRRIENRSEIPYFDRTFDECEELVNEFENQSKWVDVNERLPEYHPFNNFKPYLVTEDNESFISHYDQDNKKFCYVNSIGNKIFINVIAWMELPKPFKS